MTTRAAGIKDRGALIAMAQRFLSADGPYGARFVLDVPRVTALADRMLTEEGYSVRVADDGTRPVGMLSAFLFDHPLTGERIAAELCWWMEPEVRGSRAALRLLRETEAWARAQGAAALEMIAPDEHVATFYGRLGYERTDVHYRKPL